MLLNLQLDKEGQGKGGGGGYRGHQGSNCWFKVSLKETDLQRQRGGRRRVSIKAGSVILATPIEKLRLFHVYSGWAAGVSLALLSVILFSSSSSDTRSREVPSTCS